METKPMMTFEVYQAVNGEWRWRIRHRNGKIKADSGEGYKRKTVCIKMLDNILTGVHNNDYIIKGLERVLP